MPVERQLWSNQGSSLPHLRCPRCNQGRINPIPGAEIRNMPTWTHDEDPIDILSFERIILQARCSDSSCGEIVNVTGTLITTSDTVINAAGFETPEVVLRVATMDPPPPMISVPTKTPNPVKQDLEAAFRAYWSDTDGCMGKLRRGVEKFLDAFNVPRASNGRFITLHNRIQNFGHLKVQENWLQALRFVGNLGTHGTISNEVLFNAMDIFEIVLEQAFGDDRVARADALAKLLKP